MQGINKYGQEKQEFDPVKHLEYLRSLHQEGPHLGNQYLEDSALNEYLKPLISSEVLGKHQKDLENLGDLAVNKMLDLSKQCEREQPQLVQFDAYGKRIDKLNLSNAWHKMHEISAEQGIVATAYDPQNGQYARLIQLIKLYIYSTSSGLYGCPLAMTDGASYVLTQVLAHDGKVLDKKVVAKIQDALNHLTTYNPTEFWTSGQWMTEKRGGSDVSGSTETVAVNYKPNKYRLYGYKWFSSATDCQVTLALARIIPEGAKLTLEEMHKIPVSLFLLKLRKKDKELNQIEIIRLKEKLGTKQLPTAELLLKGTPAYLISPVGKGIKYISHMLNITRLYNSAFAVGGMRRMIALCRDYSDRRAVFGNKLSKIPLQVKVLSDMEVIFRGNLILLLRVGYWLSKEQSNTATQIESDLLRISSPLLKLYSGKDVVRLCSEGLEYFGGLGYMENSHLPNLFRDSQVLAIWEGTTNVLCLDFYRAIVNNSSMDSYVKFIQSILLNVVSNENGLISKNMFKDNYTILVNEFNENQQQLNNLILSKEFPKYSHHLREVLFNFVRVFIGVLLLEHAMISGRDKDVDIFTRWLNISPKHVVNLSYDVQKVKKIGLDTDALDKQRGCGDKDSRGLTRPRF
ncbi:hypothetical protein ABPG72_016873 [Tetrahymena utriculariae]